MSVVLLYICIICYVAAAAFLVLMILMQEGKGGGLSGIGGGAIGDTFGFSNASTELRKLTRYSAVIFFVLALALTFLGEKFMGDTKSEFLKGAQVEETVPAVDEASKADEAKPGEAAPAASPKADESKPAAEPVQADAETSPAK